MYLEIIRPRVSIKGEPLGDKITTLANSNLGFVQTSVLQHTDFLVISPNDLNDDP